MQLKDLRRVARSSKWQLMYNAAKELNIKLFNNNKDLTAIQMNFLRWLEAYNSMYLDSAMEEDFISKEVIEDDLRCEAYLLWKNKIKYKEIKNRRNNSQDKKNDEQLIKNMVTGIPSVSFVASGKRR